MKMMTAIFLMALTAQTFGATTLTLKKDILLEKHSNGMLFGLESSNRGNSWCQVSLSSIENKDQLKVAAGTEFEITNENKLGCDRDWGRQCQIRLSARNHELNVEANIICKSKGLFASEFDDKKINSVGSKILSVK